MATTSQALTRIQNDLATLLPEQPILDACRAAGHTWRQRQLRPVQTLHLFILPVMACNTAMTHLRLAAREIFSVTAYCKARMRLPLVTLQTLLRDNSLAVRRAAAEAIGKVYDGAGLWRGLRALLVDGSSTTAPDTPALQKAFEQPTNQ